MCKFCLLKWVCMGFSCSWGWRDQSLWSDRQCSKCALKEECEKMRCKGITYRTSHLEMLSAGWRFVEELDTGIWKKVEDYSYELKVELHFYVQNNHIVIWLYKYTLSKSWFKQSINLKIEISILNIWSTAQSCCFSVFISGYQCHVWLIKTWL